MNKIQVALVFDNKKIAEKFVHENAPNGTVNKDSKSQFVYETPMLCFDWIKPFTDFKGKRINFVFTTEAIRDTVWFDTVVRPMQIVGTGAIDQKY